jgi:hypothetical protein
LPDWVKEHPAIKTRQESHFTEETEETEKQNEPEDREETKAISEWVCNGKIVIESLDSETQKYINEAVENTLPRQSGKRNDQILPYCRWLQGHPAFTKEKYNTKAKLKPLEPLVRLWHSRALPFIETKSFEATWAAFCYVWLKVKYPKGDNMLKVALEKTQSAQDYVKAEKQYETDGVKLLVRLCFELQKQTDKEPFWLSLKSGAGIFGVSKPTIGSWLAMLETDGVLELVTEHTDTLATRYRFIAN